MWTLFPNNMAKLADHRLNKTASITLSRATIQHIKHNNGTTLGKKIASKYKYID